MFPHSLSKWFFLWSSPAWYSFNNDTPCLLDSWYFRTHISIPLLHNFWCSKVDPKSEQLRRMSNLVKRNAGPRLMPFDARNLNRLKISHLDRTGIPCSICRLNCIQGQLEVKEIKGMDNLQIVTYHIGNNNIWFHWGKGTYITRSKPRSYSFANWDSCFNTTILSWQLPLYTKHFKIVQIQPTTNLKIGIQRLYLEQGFDEVFIEGKEEGREKYRQCAKHPLIFLFHCLQFLDPSIA